MILIILKKKVKLLKLSLFINFLILRFWICIKLKNLIKNLHNNLNIKIT